MASVIMNSCALVALIRSRTLSPNIRLFSMNFLVSNLLFCTGAMIPLLLGIDLFSDRMDEHCISRLLGAALMIKSYFVTSFSITAMALDRTIAIIFPFKYIEFLQENRTKKACVCMWVVGFFITLTYNIINGHLILACADGSYKASYITMSVFRNKLTIVGIVNLLILIFNITLFLSLLFYLLKKNYKEGVYAISVLKRLSVIFAVYAVLYGPFCVVTIVISFFPGQSSGLAEFGSITVVLLLITFIVDPILYAWRYKMCRLHMTKILCFFRKTKVDEITNYLNDYYCTYRISTNRRTVSSDV